MCRPSRTPHLTVSSAQAETLEEGVTWTAIETGEGATLWQYTDQVCRRHSPYLSR